VFKNYYASDVPCLPSRTALFSSRFGIHTGVVNHSGMNADIRHQGPARPTSTTGDYLSFPRALRDADHHTAFISPFPQRHGAWHTLDGFDEWHDTGGGGMERAEVVYPHAKDWLETNGTDEDWYLHVNFWDPHTPYDTPESYGNPFEDEPAPEFPDAETISEQYDSYGPHSAHDVHHGYLTGNGPADLERTPDEIASREDFEQWVDGYDTGIRYMDDYIAKLLDLLESQGILDETLIIVSADHGENQGELNVYGDHQTADDTTARVPLVVCGPGIEAGVDDALRYTLDLGPTLVDLVGGTKGDGWDGRSFADALAGDGDGGRDALVVSQGAWACQRGVRWDDWLLLCTYHDGWKAFDAVELYDLAEDPHETTDCSTANPDVVDTGLAHLNRWHSQRQLDAATSQNGGNSGAPRGLIDPLFEDIEDGGPTYLRGMMESYTERLRATGREPHAETIEARDGIVEQRR